MDIYQATRELAYDIADQRSKDLGVPLDHYRAWQSGQKVESVERAMLKETDDLGRRQAVRVRS